MVLLADRYELGRKIGEGGAAVVYEGRDRRLDRPVAIKVPRAQIAADDRAVARFRREARAAANLTHPNVVQVYDFGQGDLVEQEGDTSEPERTVPCEQGEKCGYGGSPVLGCSRMSSKTVP